MSTARLLIKQGDVLYRFLRVETQYDGSLIVLLDRDPRSNRGGLTLGQEGTFVPIDGESDRLTPSAKYSVHTTGMVHRYVDGRRRETIYIEPLYALTRLHCFALLSFPRPNKLPVLSEDDKYDTAASIEYASDFAERVWFAIEIGPKPCPPSVGTIALNYEVYSMVLREIPPFAALEDTMRDHFITAIPSEGAFKMSQIDKANAELNFYRAAYPGLPPIYREEGGAYVIHAAVLMRISPVLRVVFNRADLRVESIPFDSKSQPTHKVRFWICDKGGRNKKDDLRGHIVSADLDAEL